MWAFRRAGNPLRLRVQQVLSARSCTNLEALLSADAKSTEEHNSKDCQKPCCRHQSKPTVFQLSHSSGPFVLSRTFSSQAGAKSGDKEDELEDGFSDLEVLPEAGDKDAGLTSEDSSDEDAIDGIDLPDVKPYKEQMKKNDHSPLLKLIMDVPRGEVVKALEKWTKDGNTVEMSGLYFIILNLRRRKFFSKALELLEWGEESKQLELGERHYASRLDLVAKTCGLRRAEEYIVKIPASHRGELVYRTLLANCVSKANVSKAEQVFNRMKDLGLPVSIFACNQLLLLYRRVDRKKIADVLAMMEKENVKPSIFTYKLLVDTKGTSRDIAGMEKVVESMQEEGVMPDQVFQAKIASHYICAGYCEKAEAILKSVEGDDIKGNRNVCKILLPLYALLGKKDEVERIWKVCEDNTSVDECVSAVEAFGRLGDVEKAEELFEDMQEKLKRPIARIYNALLNVYVKQKLFDKGRELAKRMKENGVRMGIPSLDALVKLYVDAGDVEKADSVLHKLSHKYKIRPQYNSYLMLLSAYSKKADVPNSEKIFSKLRQVGYSGRIRQYQLLLEAYLHSKSPAYGFRERMKADNIFPNGAVATLIAVTDPFSQKNSLSQLFD